MADEKQSDEGDAKREERIRESVQRGVERDRLDFREAFLQLFVAERAFRSLPKCDFGGGGGAHTLDFAFDSVQEACVRFVAARWARPVEMVRSWADEAVEYWNSLFKNGYRVIDIDCDGMEDDDDGDKEEEDGPLLPPDGSGPDDEED